MPYRHTIVSSRCIPFPKPQTHGKDLNSGPSTRFSIESLLKMKEIAKQRFEDIKKIEEETR